MEVIMKYCRVDLSTKDKYFCTILVDKSTLHEEKK